MLKRIFSLLNCNYQSIKIGIFWSVFKDKLIYNLKWDVSVINILYLISDGYHRQQPERIT